MKVYIVTRGALADYHIECVTRSREKAEEYIKVQNPSGDSTDYDVRTFDTKDLDEYLAHRGSLWLVAKSSASGIRICQYDALPWEQRTFGEVSETRGYLSVLVKAKDEAKALKIALGILNGYEPKEGE